MGEAGQLVGEYLDAYTSGDIERTLALLSEDISFRGPMQELSGREAFSAVVAHIARHACGHRVLRQWEDGNEVCTLYELEAETSTDHFSVAISEWNTVRDGKLAASVMIFDTGPFR